MGRFVLHRAVQLVVTLCLASLGVWYLIYLIPGSPVYALLGPDATPSQVAAERTLLGLNKPVLLQYFIWLKRTVHGHLGTSAISGYPVTTLISQRLPASVQLMIASFLLGLIIALPVAIFAARRPRSWIGLSASGYSSVAIAIPQFWLGLILILFFAVWLHVLPATAAYIPFVTAPVAALKAMALPALTLGIYLGGIFTRFLRSAMEEALEAEFITAARAKGAGEPRVTIRHALRNASLPTVTMLGLQFGPFIGGAVVTEAVFQYPGLGSLVLSSVLQRDYAVLQAVILLLIVVVAVANFLADVAYTYLDPRVRYST